MDAFITAGGIPGPDDPLYPATRGQPKAMLDVAGRPMIQWVLDALSGAARVDRVVVVGLGPEAGIHCEKPVSYLPNQGHMLDNIQAGIKEIVRLNPSARLVLAATSDIPAVTSAMIDWAVERCEQTDHDLYYLVVERSRMERRFPGSNRSYVRLKETEVCGGDMSVIRAGLAADRRLWERMVAARKNALKQASFLGWDVLALMLLGRLTLESAERMVSRRIGLRGRVIVTPYAEVAMDIDKPHQLEILRNDLAARAPATA